MVDLAKSPGRIVDSAASHVGAELVLDSAGHAWRDELPVNAGIRDEGTRAAGRCA